MSYNPRRSATQAVHTAWENNAHVDAPVRKLLPSACTGSGVLSQRKTAPAFISAITGLRISYWRILCIRSHTVVRIHVGQSVWVCNASLHHQVSHSMESNIRVIKHFKLFTFKPFQFGVQHSVVSTGLMRTLKMSKVPLHLQPNTKWSQFYLKGSTSCTEWK